MKGNSFSPVLESTGSLHQLPSGNRVQQVQLLTLLGEKTDITRRKPTHFRRQAEAMVTVSLLSLPPRTRVRELIERHYC